MRAGWASNFLGRSVLLLFLFFYGSTIAYSDERILIYKSTVEVMADRSIRVTEEIRVRAEGDKIRRGIFRSLPRYYLNASGKRKKTRYEIVEITSDAPGGAYHTQSEGDFLNIYVGDEDVFLDPGEYNYTFKYVVSEQVGFFDSYDEIYWNVTGNEWTFPIDSIYSEVITPLGAKVLQKAAYSGYSGETGCACEIDEPENSKVITRSNKIYAAGEGLTVSVAWPKGVVQAPPPPGWMDDFDWYFVVGLLGWIISSLYFLWAWNKVGRDPNRGTIIPLFSPPMDLSPAVLRFIYKTGFDSKVLTSALVNMAVKGSIKIEEVKKKFTLVKMNTDVTRLSPGEKKIFEKLFKSRDRYELKKTNYKGLERAKSSLRTYLKLEYEKGYFKQNFKWLIPGFLISLATFAGLFLTADEDGGNFLTIWLFAWSFGVSLLLSLTYKSWKFSEGKWFMTLFSIPFVLGEFVGLFALSSIQGVFPAVVVMLLAFGNIIFYYLMQAPTEKGGKMLGQIEGFRLYLTTAESDRLSVLHPPKQTPELFERFLPYAIALGAEKAWGERFHDILLNAIESKTYSPAWYSGSHALSTFHAADFSSSLSDSFSSSVSSYSSAPGSSSGSGGGGFSGGGGGGGGGGGW